jgi:hypothetical protein
MQTERKKDILRVIIKEAQKVQSFNNEDFLYYFQDFEECGIILRPNKKIIVKSANIREALRNKFKNE